MEMLLSNVVINAIDSTLEIGKISLNGIRSDADPSS